MFEYQNNDLGDEIDDTSPYIFTTLEQEYKVPKIPKEDDDDLEMFSDGTPYSLAAKMGEDSVTTSQFKN